MPRRRRTLGAAVAIGFLAGAAGSATSDRSADAARPPYVDVWVPYWGSTAAVTRFASTANGRSVTSVISPFVYSALADGSIATVSFPSSVSAAIQQARSLGKAVIPTVADGAGTGGMAAILADPARRAGHIAALVDIVVGGYGGVGYDGIDLDYEQFAFADDRSTWATTMPNWVQFVKELSVALHGAGRQLYVTIPPVWSASAPAQGNTSANYWVYAQDQLLPFVDKLRLMVYDWSPGTPSANAPLDVYVQPVVAYSSRVADAVGQPRSKLELGVPAYGRHWKQSADGSPCPDGSLGTSSVTQVAAADLSIGWNRDTASGELKASWTETASGIHTWSPVVLPPYTPPSTTAGAVAAASATDTAVRMGPPPTWVTCTVRHTIWYPDEWSVGTKAQVALNAGWGGVVIWAGGYEVGATYDVLAGL
ncbi:MAG: glycosyl hydrolase family 18 protein [Ilumatobacteraceae bacterium]